MPLKGSFINIHNVILVFLLSLKLPLIIGYIHTPTHKSVANQGLFTGKGHKNTKTHALNHNHNQPNHLLINLRINKIY
jgi:hypothetical protein